MFQDIGKQMILQNYPNTDDHIDDMIPIKKESSSIRLNSQRDIEVEETQTKKKCAC